MSYPNPMRATNTSGDTTTFDINPFPQGCGSSLFPPNATAPDDFENTNPVNSRCDSFGLGGGANGGDIYQPYSHDSVVMPLRPDVHGGNSQCYAGWEIYWRQSMPGYQNQAMASDGTPMKNWWPMLFISGP